MLQSSKRKNLFAGLGLVLSAVVCVCIYFVGNSPQKAVIVDEGRKTDRTEISKEQSTGSRSADPGQSITGIAVNREGSMDIKPVPVTSQLQLQDQAGSPETTLKKESNIVAVIEELALERDLWDQYQQENYRTLLESTLEPKIIFVSDHSAISDEDREYLDELIGALKFHRRLIRDVRLFHDEIKFREARMEVDEPYRLFDLKMELNPFARQSALSDALHQAMSALVAGIYQDEAITVLKKISDEMGQPVDGLHEQQVESPNPHKIGDGYNLRTRLFLKIAGYSDTLSEQSYLPIGGHEFQGLEYVKERISDILEQLYQVSLDEMIGLSPGEVEDIERFLYSRN